MKTSLIADSSGIISLTSQHDRNHAIALVESEKYSTINESILVPSDVFSETINILGKKAGHSAALTTASILREEAVFIIVEMTLTLREEALKKFAEQQEGVSFTDCMVMAFADHYDTKHIFGFDEVFKKNGYHALSPR